MAFLLGDDGLTCILKQPMKLKHLICGDVAEFRMPKEIKLNKVI